MRMKVPKRAVSIKTRRDPIIAQRKNECWSMDFVSDELWSGRRLHFLTIVDNFTRESPGIGVGVSCRGTDVIRFLEEAIKEHGQPAVIKVDNGPEFVSKELDLWAYSRGIKLDFHDQGSPPTMRL
jgi:putative transposase